MMEVSDKSAYPEKVSDDFQILLQNGSTDFPRATSAILPAHRKGNLDGTSLLVCSRSRALFPNQHSHYSSVYDGRFASGHENSDILLLAHLQKIAEAQQNRFGANDRWSSKLQNNSIISWTKIALLGGESPLK